MTLKLSKITRSVCSAACSLLFAMLLLSTTAGLGGCKSDPDNKIDLIPTTPSLTLNANGDAKTLYFECSGPWSLTTAEDWLFFDKDHGEGNGVVRVSADKYRVIAGTRTDQITIWAGNKKATVSVVQVGPTISEISVVAFEPPLSVEKFLYDGQEELRLDVTINKSEGEVPLASTIRVAYSEDVFDDFIAANPAFSSLALFSEDVAALDNNPVTISDQQNTGVMPLVFDVERVRAELLASPGLECAYPLAIDKVTGDDIYIDAVNNYMVVIVKLSNDEPPVPPEEDVETFTTKTEQGFTYRLASDFAVNKESHNGYIYVGKVIDDMVTFMPAALLGQMREIPIRFNAVKSERPVVEYVSFEGGDSYVRINDVPRFYENSAVTQPWLLMKYMAEAYYDRYLSVQQKGLVAEAFEQAYSSGSYSLVSYYDGTTYVENEFPQRNSPALDGVKRYFMELSTAYWGKNDTYPFDYHDLMEYDAAGFSAMESIWGARAIKNYKRYRIAWFSVMMPNSEVGKDYSEAALTYLTGRIESIGQRGVPKVFQDLFRRRRLWLDMTDSGSAAYHPGRQWLIENSWFIEKYNCVEVSNMKNFVAWSSVNQPQVLLHELTHFIHGDCLSTYPAILSTYKNARDGGLLDNVTRWDGGNNYSYNQTAYAKNNEWEYLAEQSEAYWESNEFFPYTRTDLQGHDPQGYALLQKIFNPDNFTERYNSQFDNF